MNKKQKYFASSNPHPSHSRAHDRYNKFLRILETSTPNSFWTLSKTRQASCSGGILAGSTGEYWRAAPARYWPDTRQDPLASYSGIFCGILGGLLWWDTRRDPLASYSGGIFGGIHWQDTLGYSAGYSADTRRDPLASRSGGILGGIHWRAALAGYWAGSTGEQLWLDIHWRAALAGCSPGSSGELLWRDTGWGRGVIPSPYY